MFFEVKKLQTNNSKQILKIDSIIKDKRTGLLVSPYSFDLELRQSKRQEISWSLSLSKCPFTGFPSGLGFFSCLLLFVLNLISFQNPFFFLTTFLHGFQGLESFPAFLLQGFFLLGLRLGGITGVKFRPACLLGGDPVLTSLFPLGFLSGLLSFLQCGRIL